MRNDFQNARLKLVALYLTIIGGIIVLFSVLIVYQAQDSLSDPSVHTNMSIALDNVTAQTRAQEQMPGKEILDSEYEIEKGKLYFTTIFTDESEVKVDLFTGDVVIPDTTESAFASLTDSLEEIVAYVGLIVFLLAGALALFVANKTLQPIAENMRRQKQFVSDAAHELRNPLAALHARIESTIRSKEKVVADDILKDLLSETKRLITISEDLLALEHGSSTARIITHQSMEENVTLTRERLQQLIVEKNITLQTDIGDDTLLIDRKDLQTILFNLLHNAIKFSNPGGNISLTWKDHIFTIEDSGIGISEKDLPNIYNRFFKSDTARSGQGSGLGLAIVKEHTDSYGARITVTSSIGKGSTFSIHFTGSR